MDNFCGGLSKDILVCVEQTHLSKHILAGSEMPDRFDQVMGLEKGANGRLIRVVEFEGFVASKC